MTKTRKEIVQDLLKTANYYWYDQNEDNINPINPDDYDPVVDKLFKAVSVEFEKLYDELEESRQQVVVSLARALVPDQALLPEPGYTVACLSPKTERLKTGPQDSYLITGQSATSEQYEYYFTPLYDHEYPKCELQFMLTDTLAIEVADNQATVVEKNGQATATNTVWFGFDIKGMEPGDVIPFFIGQQIADEFDRNLHALNTAKWLVNGVEDMPLEAQVGVQALQENGKEGNGLSGLPAIAFSGKGYEGQLLSRFEHSFLSLTFPFATGSYVYHLPPPLQQSELAQTLPIKDSLLWVKAEFRLPVANRFLLDNLLYPNCIPLVNRRLVRNTVVKRGFDRMLLPMPTTDLFLGVHRVQDTIDKELETSYQQVDFLHPEQGAGTFMIREGSRVRRMNRHDATRQIRRLLEVINEEYQTFKEEGVNRLREDFEVIEKAINRIKQEMPNYFRNDERRTRFMGIAHFRPGVSRLEYTYWETQGDAINELAGKTGLGISSSDVKLGNSYSVIPIQKGKGELTNDDYLNQLKLTLLSRGRIMTPGDIQRYTQTYYGRLVRVTEVSHSLMVLANGERGRGILVSVRLLEPQKAAATENLRRELQNDLNANSTFFTQIKVIINDA